MQVFRITVSDSEYDAPQKIAESRKPLRDLPLFQGHRPAADLPSRADLYEELHAEIAAFTEVYAGTGLDLDEDLERAGIEAIRNENLP